MTISYEEALREAKKNEAFERAEYNNIRQQRNDWEKYRAERSKDPQYSQQEYERDNVISYEKMLKHDASKSNKSVTKFPDKMNKNMSMVEMTTR